MLFPGRRLRTARLAIYPPLMSFQVELCAHLFYRSPLDQDAFLATSRAAQDVNRAQRHIAETGEKSAQFVVRRAVSRRRGDANLHRVPMQTCTFTAGGFRLNMD